MISEAAGATAQSDHHRECQAASEDGRICVQCHRVMAQPFRLGSRVCEHCLLGVALIPLHSEPVIDDTDTPAQTTLDRVLGAYVLIEEIGRGGMGVIYRAVHRETAEVVAIKTVLPEHTDCEETLARFQREAEAVQSLDHPHSMSIFDVGRSEDGVPFFAMKLALGGSLHQLTEKYRGRWRQTAELMIKIARAIHHAHSRGILHRDIKPGNILFTEDHEPLVTDFGLAKPLTGSNDLTQSFTVLGTPSYVAPEQAVGKTRELTAAADIYSLGAVFYELLTGRPPFVGDNPLQVLEQVSRNSPVRPRRLEPAVPNELERICMCCLERAPEDRYVSAQALAHDLERWLAGRPPATRPAHFRLRRLIKRHPALGVWCGCIGALAVAVFCVWKATGHPTSSPPPTSVAVVIDNLEQNASLQPVVRQLMDELRRDLSASQKFRLQNEVSELPELSAAVLNPLAYGRASDAQMVLVCRIRQVDDQTRLAARFLRCDTGKVVWDQVETLPGNQSIEKLPTTVEALVANLLKSWNAHSEQVIKTNPLSPHPDAQIFYARAMELTKRGNRRDMEAAISLLQRASETDPQFVDARAMLAYAFWVMACYFDESDQYALAIRAAQETLALDPECPQAHRVIASCYMSEARYTEALEEFGRAVELNPLSAGSYLSYGVCLRRMGHPEKAVPWFKRAVLLEPTYGSFHAFLAEALILCDLDEQAEASMQRAIDLEQDQPDSPFAMVALQVWRRRFDEARRLCAQTRSRFPGYRFGINFMAWIEFCDGNLSQARPYFETLRAENSYQKRWIFHGAINPASALAYIAQQAGSPEQARVLAEEASQIDFELLGKYPRNCRVLHDLAATYAAVGDEQKALQYLKDALAAGWAEHRSTMIDPRFSSVSSLPAFKELLDGTRPNYRSDAP